MTSPAFLSSAEAVTINVSAFAITLLLFGVYVAALGHDPLDVYYVLYLGSFARQISIESTLTNAAPLMLTALCTAIPARAGLLVIGGEGALVVGGVATVLAGVALGDASFLVGVTVMFLTGALAGGIWIGFAGVLRQFRGVNETISSLLLNYIAIAVMFHLISGPIRDWERVLKTSSWSVPESLRVGQLPYIDVHWGLAAGVVACLVL